MKGLLLNDLDWICISTIRARTSAVFPPLLPLILAVFPVVYVFAIYIANLLNNFFRRIIEL